MREEVSVLGTLWRKNRGTESDITDKEDRSPAHQLQAIRATREAMGPDDALICDSGFNHIWGGQYFKLRTAGPT